MRGDRRGPSWHIITVQCSDVSVRLQRCAYFLSILYMISQLKVLRKILNKFFNKFLLKIYSSYTGWGKSKYTFLHMENTTIINK